MKPIPKPLRAGWCDAAATPIYQETVTGPMRRASRAAVLTIRMRGAWSYFVGGKFTKRGCLSRRAYRQVITSIAAADFTQPRQPQIMCKARPSRFVAYKSFLTNDTAYSASPCGAHVNPSVSRLTRLVHAYVGASPSPGGPFAVPPPPLISKRCLLRHTWGRAMYSERTTSILYRRRRRYRPVPRRPMPRPYRTLTVYANGAWQLRANGKTTQGCIASPTMWRILQLIKTAQFRADPQKHAHCLAVSTQTTTIRAGTKVYSFNHPCGPALDPTLAKLRRFVLKSARS